MNLDLKVKTRSSYAIFIENLLEKIIIIGTNLCIKL